MSSSASTESFPRPRRPTFIEPDLPRRPAPPAIRPSQTPSQKWTRGKGFWRCFVSICTPLLLSALEGSVTNTALSTISDALDLGSGFSWVATAFLLASTIFQPLYGQLADIWGRKKPMLLAVAVFAVGSALCGWATNGAMLIAGRIVQGLGTGGIDLFAELILCDLVPLRKRGTYMAIKHAVFAVGTTIGPLLGGAFAEHQWRWCFWINLPVCGIALVLIYLWLRVDSGDKSQRRTVMDQVQRIDVFGTSLLTSSIVLILVPLSMSGADHAWKSPTIIVPLVFGVLGLVAFPFVEGSKWCKNPIMPPRIFNNRTSASAFALTAIHGFLTYGVQFFLPPFFQAVKGSSPMESGVQVLPCTLAVVVCAALGGPLLARFGKYRPIHQGGFASMTFGFGLCIMLAKNTPTGAWITFQFLIACGSGFIVPTTLPAVLAGLPDSTNGAAAGSWAFLRGIGSLFGVAIPSAIFNLWFTVLLPTICDEAARSQLANGQAYQRATNAFISKFGDVVQGQIANAFTKSLVSVWVVFTIFATVGFCVTFFEKQLKLRKELDTQYGLKTPKTSAAPTPQPSTGANTPIGMCTEAYEEIELEEMDSRLHNLQTRRVS
ncbi:MFS general substrate transporter [Polyplosphaeria fusca]|uniref:MFS general substrate transporter n=1 Tax=Polyplosphaeria fusca TaxID=682080 RepID=A0A9P4R073_9PLEO|nr:MFS general substrate transporter [Polyplosphaeria fusca]